MMRGTYKGSEKHLRGETALLQPSALDTHIRAQFDNLDLPMDLTHNWITYPRHHWKIEETEDDD